MLTNWLGAERAADARDVFHAASMPTYLMQQLMAYAKTETLQTLTGMVLQENTGMLRMRKEMGFSRVAVVDDPEVAHVRLVLRPDDA